VKRSDVLEMASKYISQDRAMVYGDAKKQHARIAAYWCEFLDLPADRISAHDVATMMILLKISRLNYRSTSDTWIDIAGYAALGCEMSGDEGETLTT
tara:strand:+ start:262 stop:552 length:291 start_codon:yes stop_codon:yes gene_type:complete